LGAKSGFDSIEECYGDLGSLIPAVETGLSSNPPMNWALSLLDRFSIVSNSDAHSPDKLGREATIFDMDLSFASFRAALGSGGGVRGRIGGTVEFFPQEGKYHYAGHRDCGVCLGPEEAAREQGVCPVCGKPLTEGVMGRVLELADRPVDEQSPCPPEQEGNRRPYHSLIPLKEILGEILKTGSDSRKVKALYGGLIESAGSEFSLLMDMSLGTIGGLRVPGLSGELLAEAVGRMRDGRVSLSPGYDGEYGVIRVFPAGKIPGDPAEQDLFGGLPGEFPEQESGKGFLKESPQEFPKESAGGTGAGNHGKEKSRRAKKKGNAEISPSPPIPPAGQGEVPAPVFPGEAFTLNRDQERALAYEGGRVLVIAGPGTGKTALLAARILRLLAGGTDPASILALSFTVKAAAELRERILRMADGMAAGLTVATFHSLCSALLREQGVPGDFRVLGEKEREDLLRELCVPVEKTKGSAHGSGKALRPRRLGTYIEERKRFLLLPGEKEPKLGAAAILPPEGDYPAAVPELEALYEQYRNRLRAEGLLDFEDLPAGLVRLLLAREDLPAYYRNRYRHVFVDEYQDINFAQYALIRLLAPPEEDAGRGTDKGGTRTLWLIGDPNQAIYGFRGSDKRFIDRFLEDYPGAGRFELTKSFRCSAPIIGAAGRLVGAELEGLSRQDGDAVSLSRSEYGTDKAEAEGIARGIAALVGGTGFFAMDSGAAGRGGAGNAGTAAPGDCAVLLRAAVMSGPVIKALKDHGIPFELSGERVWWEEEPVHSLLDQLRESRRNPGSGPGLSPEEEIRRVWDALSRQKEKLRRRGKDTPEPVERLIRMAGLFGNLQSLLDTLAYSGPEELPGEMYREGVRVMTIHASKGLEFDHVFIPGLEEGILPFTLYDDLLYDDSAGEPSGKSPRLEEERRILYVAMTRARRGLYLSWARSRNFRGRILAGSPSRFLGELEQLVPLAGEDRRAKHDPQFRLF
ncbi:MAG: UvrD-helicase domain-containing protein, partial [Treponema sp.]|nr:UvrD-helicase domain-containing protein [Treponema sp.]